MAEWDNTPAIGVILTQLAELYARALRLDIARRAQRAERLVALIGKTPR